MHHKNSINSTLLIGGFLALSLAACESPKPPYPDNGEPTTTTLPPNGPTTTLPPNGPTTTTSTTTTTTTAPTTTVCATRSVSMVGPPERFVPASLTINRCDTVTWTHQQPNVPHSVTSGQLNAGNAGQVFDSTGGQGFANLMSDGDTFSHTFNNAGPFPYHCIVHGAGGMIGTITVNP